MDQKELLDSISKHMDSLGDTIKWAILSAIIFLWGGVTNQNQVKVLGMEVDRSYALIVACVFYVLVNLTILTCLLRVGDLLKYVDEANLPTALTRLATHKLFCNPFSYFGNDVLSRIHSAHGFGTMIIIWWLCNASLFALSRASFLQSLAGQALQGLFLIVGLASMGAINRVYIRVLDRTKDSLPTLHADLKATVIERAIFTFLGIGIGALIAMLAIGLAHGS